MKIPTALFGSADRPLKIANIEIPCYVLDDGRRVITQAGMTDAMGMARGGSMVAGMNRLELFVSRNRIRPFISSEIFARIVRPLKFRLGKVKAYGFEAEILIDICEAVLQARSQGILQKQQLNIAHQCEVLIRGLTRVGLIALIDEATGYQEVRAHNELQRILEAYVLPEHRPWVKVLPLEFTKELYRVYGWSYSPDNKGPRYAGKLVRELIYEQLPPPVLPTLDSKNPSDRNYRRKYKHHQFLTDKLGLEHFKTQMVGVMTLLRASSNKNVFKRLFARAYGRQMSFDLDDNPAE